MAWQDNLQPASFRGVPFYVDTSQYTTGRKAQQHEFPDREEPYAEDLGRISDEFRIDGYILGDDYFEIRDRMIKAVQKGGPGELVHPYYGVKQVQVGPVSFDEDTKVGRIVRISFSFKEAGSNRFPRVVDDKAAKLAAQAEAANEALANDFADKFSVAGLPAHAVDSARTGVAAAAGAFKDATKPFTTASDGLAELAFSTRNLVAETDDLLQSPAKLATRLQGSLSLMQGALTKANDRMDAYKSLFNQGDDEPAIVGSTPIKEQERTNKQALDDFNQRSALVAAISQVPEAEFASVDEAVAEREVLMSELDAQAEATDNDEVYRTLKDLGATLVDSLPEKDSDLPVVQNVTPEQTQPSLNLVYDLFENPDSESDLLSRNSIANPLFIEGGKVLEVINVRQRA